MNTNNKKTIFSGVQPSGNLHIGNYIGAISQWVKMQAEYNCIFCVVDYHAITVKQDPKELKKRITEIAKLYLASGIDPKKSIIFQQSDIKEHTELAWIFNTITRMSDLFRMTQFKDKASFDLDKFEEYLRTHLDLAAKESAYAKQPVPDEAVFEKIFSLFKEMVNQVGVGIFDYPVLMAADILLYNTDIVPVGEDQKQHVELARDLAKRFNFEFGQVFKIPEAKVLDAGARIMGLDNPEKKMSKSATSEANYIALLDKPDIAAKKIMRAVTDSGKEIVFDKVKKPAIANLLTIYSILGSEKIKDLEKKYTNSGYGEFKKDLAEVVKKFLIDFQEKYNGYSDKEVRSIMDEGAKKLRPIAESTINKVKEKIGI